MKLLSRYSEVKPSDPLLTTRWFDVASMGLWLSYAMWAISSLIVAIPTFHAFDAPHWYQIGWAVLIGGSSLVAGLAAASIFFRIPHLKQITKKRVERDALGVFLGMLMIYHALIALLAFTGDNARFALFFLTCSYYVMPAFRMYHLNRRIKTLAGHP